MLPSVLRRRAPVRVDGGCVGDPSSVRKNETWAYVGEGRGSYSQERFGLKLEMARAGVFHSIRGFRHELPDSSLRRCQEREAWRRRFPLGTLVGGRRCSQAFDSLGGFAHAASA